MHGGNCGPSFRKVAFTCHEYSRSPLGAAGFFRSFCFPGMIAFRAVPDIEKVAAYFRGDAVGE